MEQPLESLSQVGTATIADIFDNLGRLPPVLDNNLFPIPGPDIQFAGPAYTITGESHSWSGRGDPEKLAAIDAMPAGAVAVWAGNDIRGVCCFGDLLATAMKARGCAGVVVDGGVRDLAYLRTLNLPMLTRYRTPAQSIGRWRVVGRQQPIRIRGALEDWVTVNPGDVVLADDDGVIMVPTELLSEIADQAVRWAEKDSKARKAIRKGMSLLQALRTYGHL